MVTPHSEHEVPLNVTVLLCKIFSTNHNGSLLLLDDHGRVRSQITSVACQIHDVQRFDFGCNLVVTRKVIMGIPLVLGRNPLYL